jgi:hypothetical protein
VNEVAIAAPSVGVLQTVVAGDGSTWAQWRGVLGELSPLCSGVDVATFAAVAQRTGLDPLGGELAPRWAVASDGSPRLLIVVSRGGWRRLARAQYGFEALEGPTYGVTDAAEGLPDGVDPGAQYASVTLRRRYGAPETIAVAWCEIMAAAARRFPASAWATDPEGALGRVAEFGVLAATYPTAFADLTIDELCPWAKRDWLEAVDAAVQSSEPERRWNVRKAATEFACLTSELKLDRDAWNARETADGA